MTTRTLEPTPATGEIREEGALAALRGLVARIRERIEEERRYRQTLRELSSLSDRELDDIGIGRGQIREVAREAARRRM